MASTIGAGGAFLAVPVPQSKRRRRRETDIPLSSDERQMIKALCRRRRLEVLEPILAGAFATPGNLARRRTNLTNVMLAKYQELSDVGPMFFHGKDGAEELYELFEWLREIADQVVQRHSVAEWLLLVRRAFLAPLDGQAMAPSWFMESFLRRSRTPTTRPQLIRRTYRVSPRTLEDVHDLLMITTAMWYVGQGFRSVSKGLMVSIAQPVTFFCVGIPTDPVVARCIAFYEARHGYLRRSDIGGPMSPTGIYGRRFAPSGAEYKPAGALPGWFSWGAELDRGRSLMRWRTHYIPEFFDPSSIFDLGTGQQPSIRSLAAACALWACWQDIGLPDVERKMSRGPWTLWGLHAIRTDALEQQFEKWSQVVHQWHPDWDPTAGFNELLRTSSELEWIDAEYALASALTTDTMIIDLDGASRALDDAHVRPTGGADANAWTSLFERQVQEVIDRSSWKPEGAVAGLKGRVLRYEGQDVTNIDAVACRDDTLLLIDAKALTTPRALQFGEFWAVHDRREFIETAATAWRNKIETIRAHPEILGVSQRFQIFGLIVTPDVPYLLPGPWMDEVSNGLLFVSTLAELERCLNVRDRCGAMTP